MLEDVGFYFEFTSTMRAGDRVERIWMSAPPSSLFTTLGARPILGRLPVPADEERVAVLSYGLWQSWFGGDPNVLGRTFFMAGERSNRRGRARSGVPLSLAQHAGLDLELRSSRGADARAIFWRAPGRPYGAGRDGRCRRERADGLGPPAPRAIRRQRQLRAHSSRNTARSCVRSTRNCSEACRVRCGCSSPHRPSCCSSRAPTSPISSSCAPRDASAISPCAVRSAPRVPSSFASRCRRRSSSPPWPEVSRSSIAALTLPAFLRAAPAGHSTAQRRPHHGLDDSVHASSP